MSRVEIFPYPAESLALVLSYEYDKEFLEDGGERLILAEGLPEDGELAITVRVEVADSTLAKLVPASEMPSPPVALIVGVTSNSSRKRRAVPLGDVDGVWTGTVKIPKADLFGKLTLSPRLVRTSAGTDREYACHEGALLAAGDPVLVEVDASPAPAGGYLDIRFENFAESMSEALNQVPEQLYSLDAGGSVPILWLNSGVEGFEPAMNNKARRGSPRRLRDAMYDTIVSQVWTSLAAVAFTSLAVKIGEFAAAGEESDPLEELPEWNQRVITFWATKIFPMAKPEALAEVKKSAADAKLLPDLYRGLAREVQKQAATREAFTGLVRWRDGDGV
jgi:hypothetical protein